MPISVNSVRDVLLPGLRMTERYDAMIFAGYDAAVAKIDRMAPPGAIDERSRAEAIKAQVSLQIATERADWTTASQFEYERNEILQRAFESHGMFTGAGDGFTSFRVPPGGYVALPSSQVGSGKSSPSINPSAPPAKNEKPTEPADVWPPKRELDL